MTRETVLELDYDDPIVARCVAATKTEDRVVALWGELYVVDSIEVTHLHEDFAKTNVTLTRIERGDRPVTIGVIRL